MWILFFFRVFSLPNGEVAAVRQSCLNAESGQNPTIQNIPDSKYTEQDEQPFHNASQTIFISIYIKLSFSAIEILVPA